MLSEASSKSYSSSMSPTICSSTSSIVTRPATPPYSSITMAMWLRLARNSRSSTLRRFASGVVAQQVLREQDADHVVAVLVDHREARVRGGDDLRNERLDRLVDVDEVDLGARHHDIAHLHLRDREGALDDRERVGVEQVARIRGAQQVHELLAVARLAHQQRRQALEQAGP